eukprot:snap_masked-scaffold_1-processed-gene-17.31-mRNA-1 protein AED:1.00 eAED:1.00 QI:0/0/0/0/1/1/2/0/794
MDEDPEIRTPLGKRADISTFESSRTLPGLLEEGRARPTGQGKRQRGEDPKDTVFLLKKMQEQIDELLRDNQDLRTKLGAQSGIPKAASAGLFSSAPNVSSGLKKKDFKDGFGSRLSDTSKSFGNSMLYLAARCRELSVTYNEDSILNKLYAVLPLQTAVRLRGSAKSGSLLSMVQAIDQEFNSEYLVLQTVEDVKTFKADSAVSMVQNLRNFLSEVENLNYKCSLRPVTKAYKWDVFKALNHFTDVVISAGCLRAKFFDLWHDRMMSEDIEGWTIHKICEMMMKAELSEEKRKGSSKDSRSGFVTVLNSKQGYAPFQNGRKRNCIKCDETFSLRKHQKFVDVHKCTVVAKCDVCHCNHMTKHHELGLSIDRAKHNFGNNKRGGTKQSGSYEQGANAMSAQNSEAREEKDKCALLKGAQLCGLKKAVLLDTGAYFNAISKDFFEKNFAALNLKIKEVSTTRHAGGGTLKVLGEVNLWIEIANQAACIPFRILNTLTVDVLLGMPICSEVVIDYVNKKFKFDGDKTVDIFKWEDREKYESISILENMEENYLLIVCNQVDTNKLKWEDTNKGTDENYFKTLLEELDIMKKEKMEEVNTVEESENLDKEFKLLLDVVRTHPGLFSSFKGGLLKIPPLQLSLNAEPDEIKNKASKVRPLAFKELLIVKQWIEKGMKDGLLETSNSKFRSSVFPVEKPMSRDKDGNMKKNYRVVTPFFNINKYLSLAGQCLPSLMDIKSAVAGAKLFTALDLRKSFFFKSRYIRIVDHCWLLVPQELHCTNTKFCPWAYRYQRDYCNEV